MQNFCGMFTFVECRILFEYRIFGAYNHLPEETWIVNLVFMHKIMHILSYFKKNKFSAAVAWLKTENSIYHLLMWPKSYSMIVVFSISWLR